MRVVVEKMPIVHCFVGVGSVVNSACIVLDGSIEYEANKLYKDSKLNQIIRLLEFASTKKATSVMK